METLHAKRFIDKSRQMLAGKDVRRLSMLHAGVTVGLGLVVTLLQYVLTKGIGNTSGLSGIGTRSILETIQTVLQWANIVLVPFWNLGFLYMAMLWNKGEDPRKADLLMGFRRVGSCIGLLVNRFLLSFCVMFICMNVCTSVYMLTPASGELMELATAAGGDMDAFYAMLEQMDVSALLHSMLPVLILWGVLCLVLLVPLMYRFRFAEFVILQYPGMRGMGAMLISAGLMRRRCWKLFKLDLRLWWYYGLQLLCMVLLYADVLLQMLGIPLPLQADAAYFVVYLLYLAAFFCVQSLFRPQVETAYAAAYETISEMGPHPRKNQTVPQKMPWDTEE